MKLYSCKLDSKLQDHKNKLLIAKPCACGCDERDSKKPVVGFLFISHKKQLCGVYFNNNKEIDKIIKQLEQLKEN